MEIVCLKVFKEFIKISSRDQKFCLSLKNDFKWVHLLHCLLLADDNENRQNFFSLTGECWKLNFYQHIRIIRNEKFFSLSLILALKLMCMCSRSFATSKILQFKNGRKASLLTSNVIFTKCMNIAKLKLFSCSSKSYWWNEKENFLPIAIVNKFFLSFVSLWQVLFCLPLEFICF